MNEGDTFQGEMRRMRYDEYDGLAREMDFIQAVKAAKEGVKVTREVWAEPDDAYR